MIARYVEDINLKYGIALSYTHLEVFELGHWAEMLQVATCSNDQPKPQQPHQQMLQVTTATQDQSSQLGEKQVKIDRLTNMAAQWSTGEPHRANNTTYHNRHQSIQHHSTPNMSPFPKTTAGSTGIMTTRNSRGTVTTIGGPSSIRQETDQRRYSQTSQHVGNNNVNVLKALENYSAKQALTQSTLNSIQEYNGSDREATIPWLDQVELVAERIGIDPLEVGISKLKGLTLGDISTKCKEEGLSWHKFWQCLIEQYSNVPYMPDAMFAYSKISQPDNQSTAQYLVRAKVLLECIHLTSKLVEISGCGMDNLSLV